MPLKFVSSQKGKRQLVLHGFIYGVHRENTDAVVWRCIKYKESCRGRVYTSSMTRNGTVLKITDHNHGPNAAFIESRLAIAKIKKRAKKSSESTGAIVSAGISNITEAAAAELPSVSSLHRTVQRTRTRANPQLPTPSNVKDLEIPEHFKVTNKGESFLMHDSGGKKQTLIFTTAKNLECLSSCDVWFADGTFKSVPACFAQLYTIHGFHDGKVLPLVYILAPGKQKRLYISVLTVLKELEPRLKPDVLMIDYEQSFISAFEASFPDTTIKGCHFHFAQCVYRHVQTAGLQNRYGSDSEFASAIKMLIAIAYVPIPDVTKAFEVLKNSEYFTDNRDDLREVVDYYEHTWVGLPRRNKRWKALFD
ncbi:uncharacterized protein LOC143906816 [Temnothorax americanus]|uniref:uncharacterized protein LOC143906816 n=1 Tax=Temnothorax americanus TaxID=1964332 RepID=UPI0040678A67